ncbi:HlyD family efflux transporter periplasmic adaptor subunit [Microvirga pakistanensis]|uniref:HlyD family efflux transporter periplasmic adaptor subunit n=1 Tax=Microvirga pakistanensis TaxID=1682650 RepID=UPI00106D20B1|nr:HlyD family efflux transporter periplasmic adaptor subunit [Microvirga pakistanensis]
MAPANSSSLIGNDEVKKENGTCISDINFVRANFDAAEAAIIATRSGKRSHPRFTIPFIVEINGVRYPGKDISLGGVALASPVPTAVLGNVYDAAVCFEFESYSLIVSLKAEAVRLNEDQKVIALRFVGLEKEPARLLQSIFDKSMYGGVADVSGILPLSGTLSTSKRFREPSLLLRRAGFAARIIVILSLSAVGAKVLYSVVADRLTSIHAEYAAVAGASVALRAAETGYFSGEVLAGSLVKQGDELGTISSSIPSALRADWEGKIVALEARLHGQRQAHERARSAMESFSRATATRLAKAQEERQILESQTRIQRKKVDRLTGLAKNGAVTQTQVDEEELKLSELRRLISQIDASIAEFEALLESASRGAYAVGQHNTERTPAEIEYEIQQIDTELSAARATFAALVQGTPVKSPCTCIVQSTAVRSGEFVERGAKLFIASPIDQPRDPSIVEIDALVPISAAHRLAIGGEADVQTADHTSGVAGVINSVSFHPDARAGLPDALRVRPGYAVVTVALERVALTQVPQPGVPARVSFRAIPGLWEGSAPSTWLAWSSENLRKLREFILVSLGSAHATAAKASPITSSLKNSTDVR